MAVLFGVAMLSAQAPQPAAPPQTAPPLFRSGATLVEFTIVATDGKGNPITDLKQDQLAISDDGKPRPISFFRFEGETPIRIDAVRAPVALERGMFTNRSEYTPGPPRNITAIVIDSLNTRPEDQAMVRLQVIRYLQTLTPATRVAVYRTGDGVHVIHDFTDDLASLRARIAKLGIEEFARPKEQPAVEKVRDAIRQGQLDDPTGNNTGNSSTTGDSGDTSNQDPNTMQQTLVIAQEEMARLEEYYQQNVIDERSDLTLLALQSIGNHLAGIPGRKNLIWITGGTPTMFAGVRDPWPKSYEPAIKNVAQQLASEGIAMYPVVATGITPVDMATSSIAQGSSFGQATDDVKSNLHPQANIADLRLLAGMEQFAEITGGRVSRNTNDLSDGVRLAASDVRGSYSLGFYEPDAPDNRWHDVKVTVHRPGVKLLYRRGYVAVVPGKQPKEWGQSEWDAATRDPIGSTAIRLDARAEVAAFTLRVTIQMPAQDLFFKRVNNQLAADLDIALAERGTVDWSRVRADRATVTMQNQNADLGRALIRLPKSWTLNAGTSSVRLIVRDRSSGRVGVLDIPLRALQEKQ